MDRKQSSLLEVRDLTIKKPGGEPIFEQASFEINPGEVVLLIGRTGSGKTTLLTLLAGLIGRDRNGMTVKGEIIVNGKPQDRRGLRRMSLGALLFQDLALFDDLSVPDNIVIAAHHGGSRDGRGRVDSEGSGVSDVAKTRPADLSIGQQQRVAIRRTLMADRPLLLLDEPNAALDPHSSRELAESVSEFCQQSGKAAIVVAHHFSDLLPVADRVLLLNKATHRIEVVDRHDKEAIERSLAAVPEEERVTGSLFPDPQRYRESDSPNLQIDARFRLRWFLHYLGHYIWLLFASPSVVLYLALGAVMVGFVSTWFVFEHFPHKDFLGPLVHDDTVSGIGFVQFRILVPVISAILLASRNGALISADLGHRVYTNQIGAMRNLNLHLRLYFNGSIAIALMLGTMLFSLLLFGLSGLISYLAWQQLHPGESWQLWRELFLSQVWPPGRAVPKGLDWIALKAVLSALAIAGASLWFGLGRKDSVIDINRGIANAIIVGVSAVLVIHTVVALFEFSSR